ncbi:MAG TPA: sulfatase [bacterium]|nr:sulfatase [bacterium]
MKNDRPIKYSLGALIGALIYIILFAYCLAAHFGFSVMGVTDPELSRLAQVYLLKPVILFELRVLAAYLAIGAGAGLIAAAMTRGIAHLFPRLMSRPLQLMKLIGIILVLHVLVFARAVVLYPQLFTEFMYEKGGFWKQLQIFLTDRVGLAPLDAALVLVLAAGFALWAAAVASSWKGQGVLRRRLGIAASTAAAAFIFGALLWWWPAPITNHGPNLIIIGADSIRPDHLSAYGYGRDTSPALKELADAGVRFDQAYVQLPRTFPSWVSLLTGEYPFSHGITTMFPSVADRQKEFHALPGILRDRGWTTTAVADYAGDIFPRIDLGFQYVDAPDFNFRTLGTMRGLEIHTHLLPYLANPWGRELFPILKEFASLGNPAFVERDVKKWLRRFRGRDRFMMAVFFSATHFPYSPPWPYYHRYAEPGYQGLSKYSKFNRINVEENITDDDLRQINAVFDGAIRATDDAVAGIMEALRDDGLADNTIVVFLTDHGENLYENGNGMGHGDHLRGPCSLRIPLIIHDPRQRFAVKAVAERVREIDLMPTLLDLVGLPAPAGLPAVSLRPLMEGKARGLDLPVYAETGLWFVHDGPGFFQKERIRYPDVTGICWFEDFYNNEIVRREEWEGLTELAKHRALIEGDYKVIYVPLPDRVKWELYDLSSDPEERHDLAAERPAELERMKQDLFKLLLTRPGWTVAGGYYVPVAEER